MKNFEIVKEYMANRYPDKTYAMRQGNACVWVSMGLVEMYFIVKDEKIVDIQVD
jgi:hypothetical protein